MLQINSISFSYNKNTTIHPMSYNLDEGKTLAIIGESGCGKSTFLKLIYGLYDLNQGEILWKNKEVLGPKFNLIPGMDFIKYLAQDFDLMPFITVAENVGKYLSNTDYNNKQNRISQLLEVVEMTEFANTKAKFLSGGQMQRVAIARVLALEPEILLLDEPFSHIDNFRKNSLRRKLFAYFNKQNITTIVATHDSTDVLSFADEVMVMKAGKIVVSGIPHNVYKNPLNSYVASLFGDVNELVIDEITKFIYPHQLQVTKKSEMHVVIINSYFRGNHYLIEALHKEQLLFFENNDFLESDTKVFLKLKDL